MDGQQRDSVRSVYGQQLLDLAAGQAVLGRFFAGRPCACRERAFAGGLRALDAELRGHHQRRARETTCAANHEYSLFGINIRDSWDGTELSVENTGIEVFSPAGEDSTSNQYILDGISVRDGWGRDFYYYSPAPYQRYTLWSGGENGRTFPPWISRKGLSSKANQCISLWIWDDIIHMTH